MALKMQLGQYYHAQSPIHALDPRTKICCGFALVVAAFLIRTPVQLLVACLGIAALVFASRIPAKQVLHSMRPMLMLLVVLGLFNLFWTQTGTQIFALGPLRITWDGFWAAILYTGRMVVAILVGALILLTTTPTQLTDGLDALFAPLARLGLPAHEIAMVVALTLRFVPIMVEETSQIIDAQTARGGGIAEGSMTKRVRSIGPILVALFAGAMRHANNLSRALDARCYEGGAGRTHWHPLALQPRDFAAIGITVAILVALLASSILGVA